MKELIYAFVALLFLLAIILLFRKKWKSKSKINFVLILAFVFIFAGLFYNDKPGVGYLLLTIGAMIAIVERIWRRRNS